VAVRATPNETFLRLAFRGAVGSALAGSIYVAALPGSAQTVPRPGVTPKPDIVPVGERRCDPYPPLDVHLLRPQIPLDYLSSRSDARIWNAVGLPCRGATDRKACDAAIAAADGAMAGRGPYLLGTRGDHVLSWAGPEEWLALVGRIEDVRTATEFLRVKCIEHTTAVQQVADGFQFEIRETKSVRQSGAWHDIATGNERGMQLSRDGKLTVLWTRPFERRVRNAVIEGRRPPGLLSKGPRAASLGAHFARAAMHEAASIHAFTILAAELRALDAPAELAERCDAAAIDEVRHAKQMSRLARRFGHSPERAVVAPVPLRGAGHLALDNAVEGCVHETYAALIAVYQARCAEDPAVAEELSMIADDETRHAALSWDIDAWLRPQLARELQAAVARTQRQAVDDLRNIAELSEEPLENEHERRLAGLPGRAHCRQMIDSLAPQLWTA
jgi:hypothetical protein